MAGTPVRRDTDRQKSGYGPELTLAQESPARSPEPDSYPADTDRGYQDLARAQFRAFDGRIHFTYSSGLAIQDLLRRV
jgi:hypothetical protein